MATKLRHNIQFTKPQMDFLIHEAELLDVSIPEIVRQAVDHFIKATKEPRK